MTGKEGLRDVPIAPRMFAAPVRDQDRCADRSVGQRIAREETKPVTRLDKRFAERGPLHGRVHRRPALTPEISVVIMGTSSSLKEISPP